MQFIIFLLFSFCLNAQVSYVAHRGASHLAPENTRASINLAWELGSKAAECDVLLTKDKQIVIFHDKNTSRLCGKKYKIKDHNYSDIKDLPIRLSRNNLPKYKGETIPLLQDLLDDLPDSVTLVIEIKCGKEILEPIGRVLKQHWKSGKIAFIGFGYETILALKQSFPNVPCYFLAYTRGPINKRFEELTQGPLDGINLNHNIINKKLVKRFKDFGKATWCYTVNQPKRALRLKAYGVTGITTNRPKWLKDNVSER
jgi:glycerophosphoryl diester phosphodiesterase